MQSTLRIVCLVTKIDLDHEQRKKEKETYKDS